MTPSPFDADIICGSSLTSYLVIFHDLRGPLVPADGRVDHKVDEEEVGDEEKEEVEAVPLDEFVMRGERDEFGEGERQVERHQDHGVQAREPIPEAGPGSGHCVSYLIPTSSSLHFYLRRSQQV